MCGFFMMQLGGFQKSKHFKKIQWKDGRRFSELYATSLSLYPLHSGAYFRRKSGQS